MDPELFALLLFVGVIAFVGWARARGGPCSMGRL